PQRMLLHHRLDGTGDRVVVLAGSLGSTLAMWEPQLPALEPTFRVLRYDHPGHAESPLPDDPSIAAFAASVAELLDGYGFERVSSVGLSLGGAVAMQPALDAPERIDRLVLCATAARLATAEVWEERAAVVRRDGVEAIADAVLGRWFTPAYRDAQRFRAVLVSAPSEGDRPRCEAPPARRA